MDAIDNLGDAIDVTRDRLTPIDASTWLKLAIVVFFVGGLTVGGPGVPAGDLTGVETQTGENGVFEELEGEFEAETGEELPVEELVSALIVLLLIIIALWLIYATIAAIMEFVFIESLRADTVRVRRYFNQHIGDGLRLLVFRLGLLFAFFLPLGIAGWYALTTANGITTELAIVGALLALFGLGLTLIYSLIARFTTVFVTQIMVLEGRGVLAAWRRFLPTLRGNLAEYAVYVILVWILQFAINIGFGFLAAITALAVLIPFGILAAIFIVIGGPLAILGGLVGIIAIVVLFFAIMAIRVPIDAYFRYYEFLLLGDTNHELDLIPERRESLRAADQNGAETDAGDDRWSDPGTDSDTELPPNGESPGDEGWDTSSEWTFEDDDDDDDDDEPRRGW